MAVYNEILTWANNQPTFIQDALKRIINSPTLTPTDITELVALVKKEKGAQGISIVANPINSSDIPTNTNTGIVYPRLTGIKDPININALHQATNLKFPSTGLSVVYGKNGSGKSSYSRILKRVCWSRSPDVELKKNVFNLSHSQQTVNIDIDNNGVASTFNWVETSPLNSDLKTVNVFDSECGNVYISKENATEYKPIGIDVIERLIPVLNQISAEISTEKASYNTSKPIIVDDIKGSVVGQWYDVIEEKTEQEVSAYLTVPQSDIDRKEELVKLLETQNPNEKIKDLSGLKDRILNYSKQFKDIEILFDNESIEKVKELRNEFLATKKVYEESLGGLEELNSFNGFGQDSWRVLWESARSFAVKNNHVDSEKFPSGKSSEKCVLCQQDLTDDAQARLIKFEDFVKNDISKKLNGLQDELIKVANLFSTFVVPEYENIKEVEESIDQFKTFYDGFVAGITGNKEKVIQFLKNEIDLELDECTISKKILDIIPSIITELEKLTELAKSRQVLEKELFELKGKEFLFINKQNIKKYHEEFFNKAWLDKCIASLKTTSVSKKIGEIMGTNAVDLQHQEFLNHLNYFSPELATKVRVNKKRTSHGSTFLKCEFNEVNEPMKSVLSEGEQKIIALANFLSECTIDGRKNTIVLDDPVTSLDSDFRDLIASKIVELSTDRQLIVLTHDLSFLRLLIDTHKSTTGNNCNTIGIENYNGVSGIVSDEIPYLAKNVDERISSIRKILREHDALNITDGSGREVKLDSARKRFRMLLERSVEEVLVNKAYERFSKNVHVKKNNLSGMVITQASDIDYVLGLYSKYSVSEHDGGISTVPVIPSRNDLQTDLTSFITWKTDFKTRRLAYLNN